MKKIISSFSLSPESKGMLKELAQARHRTLTAQLEELILDEYRKDRAYMVYNGTGGKNENNLDGTTSGRNSRSHL